MMRIKPEKSERAALAAPGLRLELAQLVLRAPFFALYVCKYCYIHPIIMQHEARKRVLDTLLVPPLLHAKRYSIVRVSD
jgi:hypothetical protein